MNKSESIKELATALTKFQGGMGKVRKQENNPFFKSKYASLSNIIDAIQEPLAAAGLSYAQFPDGNALTTILMHTSGEWIESSYQLIPSKSDPQSIGSAITYARRYALGAILGLNIDDDDDGNSANGKLTPASEKWNEAVVFVRTQGANQSAIDKIKAKYTMTKEHENQLLTEAKQPK